MPAPYKPGHGLADYDAKLALWRALLGATKDDFVRRVAQGDKRLEASVNDLEERLRSWKTSNPKESDSVAFMQRLAEVLPTRGRVSGELLGPIPVVEYAALLPAPHHDLARLILKGYGLSFSPVALTPFVQPTRQHNRNGHFPIWVYDSNHLETIRAGIRKGEIDQKHYYMDPDSADAWLSLVGSAPYGAYLDCLDSLRMLLEAPAWKEVLVKEQPGAVVMLAGGGAPTKDVLLIKNLLRTLKDQHQLRYCLMDVSYYMLEESRRLILEHLELLGLLDRVEMELVKGDILEMRARHRKEFHTSANIVFGITGGTIGNLSETAFFRSLERVAKAGDALIVSADTWDSPPAGYGDTLLAQYDNDDLRNFIRPVVRRVLNEMNSDMTLENALKNVVFELPERGNKLSDIPGSITVTAMIKADEPIRLFKSTRYQSDKLIAFAATHGWNLKCQIGSEHFKQFLFTRDVAG